jgi:alanyl-tRNA synthetase
LKDAAAAGSISGNDAFKLYDTYGFPIDLTQQMAEERGLKVDLRGYEKLMAEAKDRSRAAWQGRGRQGARLDADAIVRLKRMNVAPTDDSNKFAGPRQRRGPQGHLERRELRRARPARRLHQPLATRPHPRPDQLLRRDGRQMADTGRILGHPRGTLGQRHRGLGRRVQGRSRRSFGGYILHIGRMVRGELRVGDNIQLILDHNRRQPIQANHTATHMLNFALRKVLGEHVEAEGFPRRPGSPAV